MSKTMNLFAITSVSTAPRVPVPAQVCSWHTDVLSVGAEGRALAGRAAAMMAWAGGGCRVSGAGSHAAHGPWVGHAWFK